MAELRPPLRVALLAGAGILFLAGFLLFRTAPAPEAVGAAGDAVTLRSVETLEVLAAPIKARAEVSAVLEARRRVRLFAETRGPVTEVGAEALDRVVENQLLLSVDPLQAEVEVERAAATLARRRSELALARSSLERRRSLKRRGVESDAILEDAENTEQVAVAALRQARAELKQAEDDRSKKTIRAPFGGVLSTFQVEVGEYVQPGQELGELLDLETARVKVGLSDREVVAVRSGEPVEVRVEAYPGEVFRGEILRVGAASDPVSKKFPVEVEVPNRDRRLLPGMVARVALDLGVAQPRLLIPREAALDEFGLSFVWVIEGDGQGAVARRRRVQLRPIPFRPQDFEVVEGLVAGDRVALSDTRQLRDGERVKAGGSEPR